MISTRWLDERRSHWARLESLIDGTRRRGLAALGHAELRELGLLYRQAAADLAEVREDPEAARLADRLNRLLGRAHNLLYVEHGTGMARLWRFLRYGFPEVVRETLPLTLLAGAIFLALGITGVVTCWVDPAFMRFVMGDAMIETIEQRTMWTHSIVAIKPLASSAIMSNNLTVSFLAVAAGITAGIGTIYLMAYNGLLIGVIAAACWIHGMSLDLWSFVLPHGVLELPAIFIAGGAGLEIARGLLFPGFLPRSDALARSGHRAARLTAGIVPILIVAGIIEAYLSPTLLAPTVKLMFGAGAGALLVLYLFLPRRPPQSRPRSLTSR